VTAQAVEQNTAAIERQGAEEGAIIGHLGSDPVLATVPRDQQQAAFASEIEGAVGTCGQAVEVNLIGGGVGRRPDLAAVGRDHEFAISTDGEAVLSVAEEHVEINGLEIPAGVLPTPSQAAIGRRQDDSVVADGPTVLGISERDSGQQGLSRREALGPGAPLI
jgi:hypothetical protein